MASTILPEITKRIAYNRDNRDYDCYVAIDGGEERYIGSAGTYGQAEKTCNTFVFDYYEDSNTPEKAVAVLLDDDRITLAREADHLLDLNEEYTDRCCANGTPDRDCPACTAKIEAKRQQIHARAAAADTATERAEILLENHETLNGDQIFDLILDDHLVSFTWYRCIDWVLWRQAQGKPVQRCGTDDTCPATIDARFSAARDYSSNSANWHPNTDGKLIAVGGTIERWERTPEQQAEIDRTNEIMVKLFKALEGRDLAKKAA
jgi:hypothetical protein